MCLILNIEAPPEAQGNLELLARSGGATGLRLEVTRPFRWPWAKPGPSRACISEKGGCACGLLTDDAHWDAPVWDMRPEALEPLARILEALGAAIPQGFTFAPLWAGDQPHEVRVVSVPEIAALARNGRLGTRSCYRVEPDEPSTV